jgi:hypothetical protein
MDASCHWLTGGGVDEVGTRLPVLSPLLVREWNETGRMVALPCEEGRPSSSLLISRLFKLRRRYLFADSDVPDLVTVMSSLEVLLSWGAGGVKRLSTDEAGEGAFCSEWLESAR